MLNDDRAMLDDQDKGNRFVNFRATVGHSLAETSARLTVLTDMLASSWGICVQSMIA